MLFSLLVLSFILSAAQAAPFLNPEHNYSVIKDKKDPGVAPKALENSYNETKIDFQSFDLSDTSGRPIITSKTDQLVKMRTLSRDPRDLQAIKNGLDFRTEIVFERLLTTSSVRIQGLAAPFETRQDLGVFLMNNPIVVRGDGTVAKKVEGLEVIRAKSAHEVKDQISRSTIAGLLKEEILLRTMPKDGHSTSCLGTFEKKIPGAKWKFIREEQGIRFEYECEFEGWAEVKGKRVAVLKMQSKPVRVRRIQPNGVPGMTETMSSGSLYFEPESQEIMMKVETSVLAEPMEEEIERLKAKGKEPPRNRTRMWHTTRIYAL